MKQAAVTYPFESPRRAVRWTIVRQVVDEKTHDSSHYHARQQLECT